MKNEEPAFYSVEEFKSLPAYSCHPNKQKQLDTIIEIVNKVVPEKCKIRIRRDGKYIWVLERLIPEKHIKNKNTNLLTLVPTTTKISKIDIRGPYGTMGECVPFYLSDIEDYERKISKRYSQLCDK